MKRYYRKNRSSVALFLVSNLLAAGSSVFMSFLLGTFADSAMEGNLSRVWKIALVTLFYLCIETFFALGGVLPLLLVDEEKLDVLAGGQPVIDLQAGGALPSVNKNHRFHGHARSWMKCLMFSIWTFTASGAGPP